jgi:hypothetical protein
VLRCYFVDEDTLLCPSSSKNQHLPNFNLEITRGEAPLRHQLDNLLDGLQFDREFLVDLHSDRLPHSARDVGDFYFGLIPELSVLLDKLSEFGRDKQQITFNIQLGHKQRLFGCQDIAKYPTRWRSSRVLVTCLIKNFRQLPLRVQYHFG